MQSRHVPCPTEPARGHDRHADPPAFAPVPRSSDRRASVEELDRQRDSGGGPSGAGGDLRGAHQRLLHLQHLRHHAATGGRAELCRLRDDHRHPRGRHRPFGGVDLCPVQLPGAVPDQLPRAAGLGRHPGRAGGGCAVRGGQRVPDRLPEAARLPDDAGHAHHHQGGGRDPDPHLRPQGGDGRAGVDHLGPVCHRNGCGPAVQPASGGGRRGRPAHLPHADADGALDALSSALEIDPNGLLADEAYNNRGVLHFNNGDRQAAIKDYTLAISLQERSANGVKSDFPLSYFNRGVAYYATRDYPKAVSDYNKAISLQPRNAELYYNRGLSHYKLQDYPKAMADYNSAIRLDPNYALAYSNRGLLNAQLKAKPQAIKDLETAAKLFSTQKNTAGYEAVNRKIEQIKSESL